MICINIWKNIKEKTCRQYGQNVPRDSQKYMLQVADSKTRVLEAVYRDVYELSISTKTNETTAKSFIQHFSSELNNLSHPLNIPINLKSQPTKACYSG